MKPIIKKNLQGEIVVSSSKNQPLANAVSISMKLGELRKIYGNIYTPNLDDTLDEVVQRNLYPILGALFPSAVISHRSSVEAGPKQGHIVLTYKYTRNIALPGMTVHLVKGPGKLDDDTPFVSGLFLSSIERGWLENYEISKASFSKTLDAREMERRLEEYLTTYGEEKFKERVESLHSLAQKLGRDGAAKRFQKTAGALLQTRTPKRLLTDAGKSRAVGLPYDVERLERFEALFQYLRGLSRAPIGLSAALDRPALANLCFFDAYFSNYIEGTRFEVAEAKEIVFENRIARHRPDGHDVSGTYEVAFEIATSNNLPDLAIGEFIAFLTDCHKRILKAHADMTPGRFKSEVNMAGTTVFVKPDLVEGTIRSGYEFLASLESGFQRAVFAKFLVSEVHPFRDGNGRLSRIVLNRELYRAQECPIIIPTVYRPDYMGAIKKMTKTNDPTALARMLDRAQEFTSRIDFDTFDKSYLQLKEHKAFSDDPNDVLRF